MWIFAPSGGFYSAVQDRNDPDVIRVRCRDQEDAEYLVGRMASLGTAGLRIDEDAYADYRYRVLMPRPSFAVFLMEEVVSKLNYTNYKDNVARRKGKRRADVYMGVWSRLLDLQPNRPWAGDHDYADVLGTLEDDNPEGREILLADLVGGGPIRDNDFERRVDAQRRRPSRSKPTSRPKPSRREAKAQRRSEVETVACPSCPATSGARCQSINGRPYRGAGRSWHATREAAYETSLASTTTNGGQ